MEHGVYVCGWDRSESGFTAWVKSRPEIRGEGLTYADAEQRLIKAIQSAGGAMQAVLEFDPPLPKSELESKYANPELYLIGGDDRFDSDAPRGRPFETAEERDERLRWTDAFFQSPVCRNCAFASSPRSAKLLRLQYLPRRYDGAFGSAGHEGATTIEVLSDEFLSLLTPEERTYLDVRPVTRKGRGRNFYELAGPPGVPFVAVAGLPISGWRCEACGHRSWGYWIEGMAIHSFIARSSLPRPLSSIFTVGTPPEIHLCATAERWQQLVGQQGTRGFVSELLGVVSEQEVVRFPELPSYEERSRADRTS